MKITTKTIAGHISPGIDDMNNDEYLISREIMRTVSEGIRQTGKQKEEFEEILKRAKEDDDQIEIKLLINGIEKEPALLASLIRNAWKYISEEGEERVQERLEELDSAYYDLHHDALQDLKGLCGIIFI